MLNMQALSLSYGSKLVLNNVDWHVNPAECIGLVGPSGAGKSTLLRLAAGLLHPVKGTCKNTFNCTRMVFQEPRLLPWRSVAENMDIALRCCGLKREQIAARRTLWLENVGLGDVANAWPAELSGGMAQRVALARALALEPDLLLLDEPFSALDPDLRAELGQLCVKHARSIGAALVCISHQPWELKGLVDRVFTVSDGHVSETNL